MLQNAGTVLAVLIKKHSDNMFNTLDLHAVFKNPYSWGFVLFWLAMLVACLRLQLIESRQGKPRKNLESLLFWLSGSIMLVFAIFRPLGVARDDLAYLEIFKAICPSMTCNDWLQGGRDFGWYSSVGLLKSFVSEPRVMLWLTAASLLIKLAVIHNLVKHPMFSLFFYASLYYQVQDLTAWRVSFALAILMAVIWLIVSTRNYWSSWTLLLCGLFHKQAFVAPLILVGFFFRRHQFLLVLLCLIPTALLILGIYPQLHLISSRLGEGLKQITLSQGLDSYVRAKLVGTYDGWRHAPVVVYPQIMLTLWLLKKAPPENEKLAGTLTGCVIMSCLFLWGFASLPDAQVRFFEFFMVPTIMLAGIRRLNMFEFAGLIFVSSLFVTKYNIIHQLIAKS